MSDTGGTTPISSRNFPPADAGMRCGDVGAVAPLMGCGNRASGPLGDLLLGLKHQRDICRSLWPHGEG